MTSTTEQKIAEAAGRTPPDGRPSGEAESTRPVPPSPPPPRGPSLWAMARLAGVAIVMLWVGTKWGPALGSGLSAAWGRLRPAPAGGAAAQPDAGEDEAATFYTCGMHPWVILPEPGPCPICRMELTPIDPKKFTGEISIDPVVTQNIGVRIEPVRTGPLVRTIRTVGTIDYDEKTVRDINIKVSGWVEKLYVDYLGSEVSRGDRLFDLYSPDLYVAQEAYLRAAADVRRVDGGAPVELADAVSGARDLLDSARVQLEYYDVTDAQIDELAQRGTASKTLALYSPYDGVVITKHVNEGMRVDPGMQVYRIADLSRVWVMVTLYEYQLPYVQVGQKATMSLPYIPGQRFEGEVIYIYPYLDTKTRQVNVRLEFENPGGLLKPGMYASIELRNTLADQRTLVPRAAVIDTGERQVAFVSLGEGKFEPRDLRLGVETDAGMVEVLDGVRPGEMIVTSGQFLLDSEATIREGLAKMIRGNLAGDQPAAVAVEGASELSSLPAPMEAAVGDLLDAYFTIGTALAADSTGGVPEAARTIAGAVDRLLKIEIPADANFWRRHPEAATVRGKALELISAADLAAARLVFADLSMAFSTFARATGIPATYRAEVDELHCPMYREGQGGSIWLQARGAVRNPFLGSVMPECFDARSALPVTGAPAPSPPATQPPAARPDEPSASPPPEAAGAGAALDAEGQRELDRLVSAYLAMQEALAGDALGEVADPLAEIAAAAPAPVRRAAERMVVASNGSAGDLEAARVVFARVSEALLDLAPVAPPSPDVAPVLYHVYCPMVRKNWLQVTKEVANPYAPSMRGCGTVKGIVAGRETEAGES